MITGCIATRPNTRTVRLAGVFVSLSSLYKETGIAISFLSRILAKKKNPSVINTRKIAEALGVSVDEFLDIMDNHTPPKPHIPFIGKGKQHGI